MKLPNIVHPPPAPPNFADGKIIPEANASIISKIIYWWVNPLLSVGYTRPLQKDDLWPLPPDRETHNLSENIERTFYGRCPPEKRPRHLRAQFPEQESLASQKSDADSGGATPHPNEDPEKQQPPETSAASDSGKEPVLGSESKDNIPGATADAPKKDGYDESLPKALHQQFFVTWWSAGVLDLCAQALKTTSPLVNKALLTWLAESFAWSQSPGLSEQVGLTRPRGIGYGIGLAFALFVMQEAASLLNNYYLQMTMGVGLSVRAGVIATIFRKSLRLSGRSRAEHSVGQITTMISTDCTRLDHFAQYGHSLWVAPIQIIVGLGLLIGTLGYSALVGLGVLILGMPIQGMLVMVMFKQRQKGVKITDKRMRLTTEVLQGIRLLKFYGWEGFFVSKITGLRQGELNAIKKSSVATATLIATMTFIPVLASILSFITYSLSGHDLNVAIIFTSLQFFNIIQMPLIILPIVLGSMSDMLVAVKRITTFLTAEEQPDPYLIDYQAKHAIIAEGDFTWDAVKKLEFEDKKDKAETEDAKSNKKKPKKKGKEEPILPVTALDEKDTNKEEKQEEEQPFQMKDLKLVIPKGSFVAIVGRVGSGKSSILQSLVGEMRRNRGNVTFGGSCAYVPQTPWIKNATVRENILFGNEDDEKWFREVIRACSLEHDLELFTQGEETEIGEKGINLSGGQKARVSLARAAYSPSDIVLLDDPLSAVDSHVGKWILENCLLDGPLAKRTRVLVTHALHFLDRTDYIYVVEDGAIKEHGTYNDLIRDSPVFSRLMEEHGKKQSSDMKNTQQDETQKKPEDLIAQNDDPLMQEEERMVGAVTWATYKKYLRAAGGLSWAPAIFIAVTLMQCSQVGNNLMLGYWSSGSIRGFSQGDYMALYVSFGVAQALSSFLLTFFFVLVGIRASLFFFKAALSHVLRSPVSFFDTTPMGRVLSRLSKDQDTLDTTLPMTLMQFLSIFSSVLGTVGLVFYTFPYLGIIFAPLTVLYYIVSVYYRRSSVEVKRLDSLMRSSFYSSYAETLTGLATIRAYRAETRSITSAESGLDMENRAYYMTITFQHWLSVRLDLFANIVVLGIALFASGFRGSVNPAKIGVVLTYTLNIAQTFSQMISSFAQNEQNMNAVERLVVYTELPAEKDVTREPMKDLPASWPSKGEITFRDVDLVYRDGLPLVLKDVSFSVNPGEKIGIVGRTGSGKSSLLQALFRIVEIQKGSIHIDGHDICSISLDILRNRLALVPQDSTMFLGTLRENLDPMGTKTDAELISTLKRAWLLPSDGTTDPVAEAKFSLDAAVGDEGSNFSAGEKQLLALCRALVKDSRIIALDEATSSVDVETDAKLQRTIQTEFANSTLLCIAHRLNTIAHYDRVLVMDAGRVAEFGTVLELFDKDNSIFRSLCDEADLGREDILRIRAAHGS